MHRALLTPTFLAACGCLAACAGPATTASITPAEPRTLDDLVLELSEEGVSTRPDGEDLAVEWFIDGAEQVDLRNATRVGAARTSKGEQWTAKVGTRRAPDEPLELVAQAGVFVINTAPTVEVFIDPTEPRTTTTVQAVATPYDADGDEVELSWLWTRNGSPTTFASDLIAPEATRKGDVWTVTVSADDGEASPVQAEASVRVLNTPPSMSDARVEPAEPTRQAPVQCVASGWEDVDGDVEGYRTTWLVNGSEASTGAELSPDLFARGDSIACAMIPDDGEEVGSGVLSDEVIVRNAPPSLASVTIGPEDPKFDETVTATLGEAIDLDGDEVSFAYTWTVDPRQVIGPTELLPTRFGRDDVISLRVVPNDGSVDGEPVFSNTLVGGNTAPVVESVALSPDPAFTDSVLESTVTTTDPDGDALTLSYEWFVDGTALTVSDASLAGEDWFDKTEAVSVRVTANDGGLDSPAVDSDALTIANTPPTRPVLGLDPKLPEAGDEVTCQIDTASDDIDGDSLSYSFTWKLNGTTSTSTSTDAYTGDTFTGTWTDEDTITCEVEVDDGTDTTTESLDYDAEIEILIIKDINTSGSLALEGELKDQGHVVTVTSVTEDAYDGTNPKPGAFEVVIHMNGNASSGKDMPLAGQEALVDFVDDGGGFIYAQYNSYEVSRGRLVELDKLLLWTFTRDVTYSTNSWSRLRTHPAITDIGSTLRFSRRARYLQGTVRSGATLLMQGASSSEPGVAVGTYGKGRIVGFGHSAGQCLEDPDCLATYSSVMQWVAGG